MIWETQGIILKWDQGNSNYPQDKNILNSTYNNYVPSLPYEQELNKGEALKYFTR